MFSLQIIPQSKRFSTDGTYAYTLVVDGQIIDTKQMILTK